jgi:hypothetical protein
LTDCLTATVFLLAFLLSIGVMALLRSLVPPDGSAPQVSFLGMYSPLLSMIKYHRRPEVKRLFQPLRRVWSAAKVSADRLRRQMLLAWSSIRAGAARLRQQAWAILRSLANAGVVTLRQRPGFWKAVGMTVELSIVVVWALWVGRQYLDFNPRSVAIGGDSPLNIQSYFALSTLKQCGACVLWNGSYNGGSPTLAELLAPVAHPVTLVVTWVWGILNGVKLIVVIALALAGLAQWWLAKVMGLGWPARLWSAALAVVGGHLAGRMEMGLVEIVFSVASCTLVIPPALDLVLTGRRRSTILFGLFLGLALLSGQGYMQLGLLLAILPALLVLLVDKRLRLRPVWKEFALAGAIALLVAAVLWVPALHFVPLLEKPVDPGTFSSAQALPYAPLNLVINDYIFYTTTALKPLAWPHQYVNYIGWIPVLLAVLAFRQVPASGRRLLIFLLTGICLVFLISSGVTLTAIKAAMPRPVGDWLLHFRSLSEISSLAVPLILGLSAWGVDFLMKMPWPRLTVGNRRQTWLRVNSAWLVLPLPLLFAINSTYVFGQAWLKTRELPVDYKQIVPGLKPPGVAWLQPPYSDWGFAVTALDQGFKLTQAYRPWKWRKRPPPPASVSTTRDKIDPNTPGFRAKMQYLSVIDYPNIYYASVVTPDGATACSATAQGGNIDVDCETQAEGQLVVYENSWSGWSVRRDGQPAALNSGQWLTTPAPVGRHHYAFRYRPWDAVVGLILSMAGYGLALALWWRAAVPRA